MTGRVRAKILSRDQPEGGVMKSWSCTSCAFMPISLRPFPPLAKGGQGGWFQHDRSQDLPMLFLSQSFRIPLARREEWLADIALAIENRGGFPGGCRSDLLTRFLKIVRISAGGKAKWDDLGRPTAKPPTSPIWKRWRINYDADLSVFEQRARQLLDLQSQSQAAASGGPSKRARRGMRVESARRRTARRSRA